MKIVNTPDGDAVILAKDEGVYRELFVKALDEEVKYSRSAIQERDATITRLRAVDEDAEIFSGYVVGRKVSSLSDLTDDERADVLLRLQTMKAEAAAAA